MFKKVIKEWWKEERGYYIYVSSLILFYSLLRLQAKYFVDSGIFDWISMISIFVVLRMAWDWFLKRWFSL